MPVSLCTLLVIREKPGKRSPKAQSLHLHLALLFTCQGMQFISDRCVLLDPMQLAAEGYEEYVRILLKCGPQAPYQARDASGEAGSDTQQDGDDGEEVAPGQQFPKRKRKRRSKYEPNEAELKAKERADKVLPLLQSALEALQRWMEASGTTSLLQLLQQEKATPALAGSDLELVAPPSCAQLATAWLGPTAAALDAQQQGAGAASEARLGGDDISDAAARATAAAAEGLGPDYVALATLRHALHPKFEWAAQAAPVGQAPPPPLPGGQLYCNLFGQLIKNEGPQEAVGLAGGHEVVVPPEAAFLMSDIRQLQPLLHEVSSNGGFHCVVVDPPWENKSAARGAKYPTLPSRNLLPLPLTALLAQAAGSAGAAGGGSGSSSRAGGLEAGAVGSGGSSFGGVASPASLGDEGSTRAMLGNDRNDKSGRADSSSSVVALWVTNRERHRRFVEQELLPAWGLRHIATWYWLKVTAGGEPVGRLDIAHRRPYEPILLCRPTGVPAAVGATRAVQQAALAWSKDGAAAGQQHPHLGPQEAASEEDAVQARLAQREAATAEGEAAAVGGGEAPAAERETAAVEEIPDGLVLLSVPAQHSRKPHLGPLLRPYLPPRPRCLEMFARELFPGWTSWGNEALKFQGVGEHFVRRGTPR